jgi:2'-hydroxyisoflavone reductase
MHHTNDPSLPSSSSASARSLDRRGFVALSAAGAAGLLLGTTAFAGQAGSATTAPATDGSKRGGKAEKSLSILILGGTAFLGPEVVEAAKARGHSVTLFNRGKTRPELFADLPKLQGDRDPNKGDGLASITKALETSSFDVVIDNSGYYPRHVKASAELLGPKIKQYIYISSISAFKDGAPPNSDESYPVAEIPDPTVENMGGQGEFYGGLKALCEAAAEAAMPGRVTNIRPGFIVGPGDWTGRFSYWPLRARQGGEMIGPGTPEDAVQWIDVRDLAEWIIHCAERSIVGVFAATGGITPAGDGGTIGGVIDASIKVAKASAPTLDTTVTWIPTDFLMSQQVSPGADLPIWIPPEMAAGFHRWNVSKAVKAGLTFRPLSETIAGIYAWIDGLSEEEKKRIRPAGMNREREAKVLAAWKAKSTEGAKDDTKSSTP